MVWVPRPPIRSHPLNWLLGGLGSVGNQTLTVMGSTGRHSFGLGGHCSGYGGLGSVGFGRISDGAGASAGVRVDLGGGSVGGAGASGPSGVGGAFVGAGLTYRFLGATGIPGARYRLVLYFWPSSEHLMLLNDPQEQHGYNSWGMMVT